MINIFTSSLIHKPWTNLKILDSSILYKKTKHKTANSMTFIFLLFGSLLNISYAHLRAVFVFFCCTLIFYSLDIFYKLLCLWIFTFCLWYQSAIMSSFVYSSLNSYNNKYKNPVLWCHTKNAIFSTYQPTVITVISWLQKRLLTKLRSCLIFCQKIHKSK